MARQWRRTPLVPTLGRQKQADLCEFQPGLQSEFQDSQGCYTEKPCLKSNKQTKRQADRQTQRTLLAAVGTALEAGI